MSTLTLLFTCLVRLIWLIIDLALLSSIRVIVSVAARLCNSVPVFLVVDHSEKTISRWMHI